MRGGGEDDGTKGGDAHQSAERGVAVGEEGGGGLGVQIGERGVGDAGGRLVVGGSRCQGDWFLFRFHLFLDSFCFFNFSLDFILGLI